MIKKYYSSLEEKKLLISQHLKDNYTLIHDTFINENKTKTDGNAGELIFEVLPEIVLIDNSMTEKNLLTKLKYNSITFEELKQLLRLKFK